MTAPTPSAADASAEQIVAASQAAVNPDSSVCGHILLVDDDPDMHQLLRLILGHFSLRFTSAFNGHEALDMVAADRPDLIVLDLDMPGLDGCGVLESLGQSQETAEIPVMVYSANTYAPQWTGYVWPPQVIEVLGKAKVGPTQMRELVKRHLGL